MSDKHRLLLEAGCKFSKLAYEDEIKDGIKIESKLTSTTAFLVKTKTIDILCFRGTQQIRDWIFNLTAVPVPYAGRLCHGGFVAAHVSVWGKIKKHIDYDKQLLITGHSLGGALAELSAAKLNNKHTQLSLVAFGKPNTFFKGFKKPLKLNGQLSVVAGSDVVARVPRILYGPSKSQTMLYHANTGRDLLDPDPKFVRHDFVKNAKEAITDHFMPEYEARLTVYLSDLKKGKKKEEEAKPPLKVV